MFGGDFRWFQRERERVAVVNGERETPGEEFRGFVVGKDEDFICVLCILWWHGRKKGKY